MFRKNEPEETYEEDVPRCPKCGEWNDTFFKRYPKVKDDETYPFRCPYCGWRGEADCYKVIKFHVHKP